jgi:hypothetical protein
MLKQLPAMVGQLEWMAVAMKTQMEKSGRRVSVCFVTEWTVQ